MPLFTQAEWSAALVGAWRADKKVWWALERAVGLLPSEKMSGDELTAAVDCTNDLVPNIRALSAGARLAMPVRVLLARRCRFASEAMWSGDDQGALRLMAKGGVRTGGTLSRVSGRLSTEGAAHAKRLRQTRFIKARELSKWHDWGTVK
jgi:hypothetical protein